MSHPVDIHVGQKLKELRSKRRLSQTDVGRKLGLSFQQIQKYETGSNRISASRLFELAQLLDVSPIFFFDGLYGVDDLPKVDDASAAVVNAIAAIKDDKMKDRIVKFIEDIANEKVAT